MAMYMVLVKLSAEGAKGALAEWGHQGMIQGPLSTPAMDLPTVHPDAVSS